MIDQTFRAESPFIDTDLPRVQGEDAYRAIAQAESPFLNEYEAAFDDESPDATADALAEIYSELYDEEFEEATQDLVDELTEVAPALWNSELSDPRHLAQTEYVLREALSPIQSAAEAYLDEAETRLSAVDERSLSPERAFEIMNEVEPSLAVSNPVFEQFLGKLIKKVKKVAKGAVKLAKKGVTALASPLLKPLLAKLKSFVKPLLERVLQFALNKIPAQYRPLAQKLASKLQGKVASALGAAKSGDSARSAATNQQTLSEPDVSALGGSEPSDADSALADEPAAPELGDVQEELDQQLLELLVTRDSEFMFESSEDAVRYEFEDHPGVDVERARQKFVRELDEHIERGDSAAPALENFLPAVLMAVRTGIKLIGRPKVVSFLGGLLAKLIAPLIGKHAAPALGQMIADVGLRTVIQAEVGPHEQRTSLTNAVAATVEETARNLAQLPERVFESPELFELYAMEAFDHAAAANFPSQLLKPDVREFEGAGTWLSLPLHGRKLYKKFSRVFDVAIPPEVAASLPTFGGSSLAGFLRDRLRLPHGDAIAARVHLFEAIPNTRLSLIARAEKLRGLSGRGAWAKFHPLTPKAASVLLRAPKLGRELPGGADPLRPTLGQRYYYLEIPDAPLRALGADSKLHVTANLAKGEVRICAHLSEALAQKASEMLRKGAAPSAIVRELRSALGPNARALTSGKAGKKLRIIVGPRGLVSLPGLGGKLQKSLRGSLRQTLASTAIEWFWLALSQNLAANAQAFIAASEGPEDGVRVCVSFSNVPSLSGLKSAIVKGTLLNVAWPPKQMPAANVTLHAGAKHG